MISHNSGLAKTADSMRKPRRDRRGSRTTRAEEHRASAGALRPRPEGRPGMRKFRAGRPALPLYIRAANRRGAAFLPRPAALNQNQGNLQLMKSLARILLSAAVALPPLVAGGSAMAQKSGGTLRDLSPRQPQQYVDPRKRHDLGRRADDADVQQSRRLQSSTRSRTGSTISSPTSPRAGPGARTARI